MESSDVESGNSQMNGYFFTRTAIEEEEDDTNDDPEIDDDDDQDPILPIEDNPSCPRLFLNKVKEHKFKLFGCFLANISGFVFTLNNCIIQIMKLDFSETIFVRSVIQALLIGSAICYKKLSFLPEVGESPWKIRIFTIFQGFWGGAMIICGVSCVALMPLGDAMTLLFTAPLSTMILAAIFLGHRLRLFRLTFCSSLLAGAVLVVQPSFLFPNNEDPQNDLILQSNSSFVILFEQVYENLNIVDYHNHYYYIGVAIALSSALADGFLNITISACNQVHTLVLLWWSAIGGIVISLICFTFDPDAKLFGPELVDIPYTTWIGYIAITFLGMFGYFCMTKSLQMIDPTVVSFIRALEIIFGYVFQMAVMQQIPDVLALVGSSLVLISVFAVTLQDILLKFVPERFRFIF